MNRVCISEAGESNVPNTSRTARTISFDAPPAPPFLPTTNPSNSGACYCSYLCIFPPCTEEIDQKSRFQCANRSFSTKTAAGPCGFFVVPPTPLPPVWACICIYILGYLRGFSFWLWRDEEEVSWCLLYIQRGYGVIRILSVRLTTLPLLLSTFRWERIVRLF